LEAENLIADGFFDIGHAGSSVKFPTLAELISSPVDNKREVILIDFKKDANLQSLGQWLQESMYGKNSNDAVSLIANVTALVCGGAIERSRVANYPFKFRITELKLQGASNVIPIGLINKGTFYHRALLFKALCDRVGVAPCLLVRGEYNRAWNIVDLKKMVISALPETPSSSNHKAATDMAVQNLFAQQWNAKIANINLFSNKSPPIEGAFIVDLMFEPGNLMAVGSPQAEAYQRIN
jgi:Ethylene-responsive protein kinase Le-CTR1